MGGDHTTEAARTVKVRHYLLSWRLRGAHVLSPLDMPATGDLFDMSDFGGDGGSPAAGSCIV